MQMLFQWDMSQQFPEKLEITFWKSAKAAAQTRTFANQLFEGAAHDATALDELISKYAVNWRLDRMAAIDRAILRLAMHEMRATDTPVKVVINQARDVLSLGPYVYFPTGTYNQNQSLNLGANRWQFLLQLAYIKHFAGNWAWDNIADVAFSTNNSQANSLGQSSSKRPRYEFQEYLRYNVTPTTTIGGGFGYVLGGRDSLAGQLQPDMQHELYTRLSLTQFVGKSWQIQGELGRDISASQGFKEDLRINLRLAKLF